MTSSSNQAQNNDIDTPNDIVTESPPIEQDNQQNLDESTGSKTLLTRATRSRYALIACFLIAATAVAGCCYLGFRLESYQESDSATAQARDTAQDFAGTMVNYDGATMDEYIARVLDGSTGELAETFSRTSGDLKSALETANVKSSGRVLDIAVKSSRDGHIELLAVVEQTASNSTVDTPQQAINVLQISMEKVGDRWLASKVENPSSE